MHYASLIVLVAAAACMSAARQATAPATFDGKRAFEDVRQLVAIGPRVAGSPGAQQARAYISTQLRSAGWTVEEQPFEATTPLGVVRMVNVRATIDRPASPKRAGAEAGRERLIIAGHYDTKLFRDFVFVGANDGGSSTAVLLELARVLGRAEAGGIARGALGIELLFLDGEEAVVEWQGNDHTYGSRHYVRDARTSGDLKNVRALVLVDMIGDRNLRILRESQSTPWLTDVIWSAARRLQRPEFVDASTPVEDDHIEFLRAGVPAVDLIDFTYPDESNRFWHTQADTLDKVAPGSLQAVGDVLLAALPDILQRLTPAR